MSPQNKIEALQNQLKNLKTRQEGYTDKEIWYRQRKEYNARMEDAYKVKREQTDNAIAVMKYVIGEKKRKAKEGTKNSPKWISITAEAHRQYCSKYGPTSKWKITHSMPQRVVKAITEGRTAVFTVAEIGAVVTVLKGTITSVK